MADLEDDIVSWIIARTRRDRFGRAAWPAGRRHSLRLLALSIALTQGLAAASASAGLPDEGDCPELQIQPEGTSQQEDALQVVIKPGMVLLEEDLMILRRLIPGELWRSRQVFFHEGMRLEIGPCHRRYAEPAFFGEATTKFTGQSSIDGEGNLRNYTAGLPFPPAKIDLEEESAGAKLAFNLQQRYVGAGFRGKFRLSDFPSRVGSVQVYEGRFYHMQVAHRADLAASGYRTTSNKKMISAAGGEFSRPFDVRHLAWRQFRTARSSRRYSEPDDIFTYVPTMRKVRRAAISWVDGLYVPRYSVSGDSGGGPIGYGTQGAMSATAGSSIAVSEDMRRGLIGMTLRANAYHWRVLGESDILAPLNTRADGYPLYNERNFGPSGLSIANDRWDLRRAILIEGLLRQEGLDVASIKVYIDYQTMQPLYWISRTHRNRILDIGILAYRFSDDSEVAPQWPGGTPASVFAPVAALFYDAGAGAGGWRRESYDLMATPYNENEQRAMTTADSLSRGR